jgi:hypothetical protein
LEQSPWEEVVEVELREEHRQSGVYYLAVVDSG